ncbi:hypothetical protein ACFW9N_19020 [Streptomyces sp. NPDC059496]|uniref:hypothetical protein n=1 Tax=Streptomyces sp. NPDC059496 TaxID=3346851 RepID=UPI00367E892A
MEWLGRAAPGVEQRAGQAADAACHLADATGPGDWSAAAAEDALDAIDTLVEALGSTGESISQALAVVADATNSARWHLGIVVEEQAQESEPAAAATVPTPRRSRPRRRGLGPGFQGIRTDR